MTYVAPNITPSEHQHLAAIHSASSTTKLGKAVFDLIAPRLPNELLFIALLPIKFELPSLFSKPKYKSVCDNYVRHTNRYDIWLRRSPVNPSVRAVRHSDYTPYGILKKSLFFKEVMTPINSHYGASIVAWEKDQWLATLTIFKNIEQGDFTDLEMQQLLNWQAHFEIAVRRLAKAKEDSLDEHSLSSFIWDLPTAALMFDWDLNMRHHNAAAVDLCRLWLNRNSKRIKLGSQKIIVPQEMKTAMEALKPKVVKAKLSRPGPLKPIEMESLAHPQIEGLLAKIYFIPSKSLALSRGRFLIQLHHGATASLHTPALSRLAHLSRRERETALHAARGLTNREIGEALNKSPGTVKVQLENVFKKLKVKSRTQLALLLAR